MGPPTKVALSLLSMRQVNNAGLKIKPTRLHLLCHHSSVLNYPRLQMLKVVFQMIQNHSRHQTNMLLLWAYPHFSSSLNKWINTRGEVSVIFVHVPYQNPKVFQLGGALDKLSFLHLIICVTAKTDFGDVLVSESAYIPPTKVG